MSVNGSAAIADVSSSPVTSVTIVPALASMHAPGMVASVYGTGEYLNCSSYVPTPDAEVFETDRMRVTGVVPVFEYAQLSGDESER